MGFKNALKSLVEWLDRKFPDQVVVTKEKFDFLEARLVAMEKIVTDQRLKTIEAEINKFNASLGFGGVTERLKVQPFQR